MTTRTYRGSLEQATARFNADAVTMAATGYYPTSQVYAPGAWGCGAFLVAFLLILAVGLGLLILAYMVIVKPAGTLVVTYEYRAPVEA
jgi:hypothetical protein